MGIFQKNRTPQQSQQQEEENDAATIPTLAQWKQARKQQQKARAEAYASKRTRRERKIHQLVSHRTANARRSPQNEYCTSPAPQKALQEASNVGWSTTKIAFQGFFGKNKNSSK